MPRISALNALFSGQFLSAFVDNMILFIVLAIIKRDGHPGYYLPLVQSAFLASYIVLSPWVGRFADSRAKCHVLMIGNLIKGIGVVLLLANCNPALSYAVVGLGAVVYSPAKYGILPFLTRNDDALLRANSSLESYTILAILTGSVAGGFLSDVSIMAALIICLVLYFASIALNVLIPLNPGRRSTAYGNVIRDFRADIAVLFQHRQSHYSLVGTGSFWMASAVLRMAVFAWVPLVLGIESGTSIGLIIAVTGIGIALGALVTPYLIRIDNYQRTIWFGLAMGVCIFAFLTISSLGAAIVFLLLIGILGGIYIVPMNACLQQVGQRTIGEGKTIAVQNFFENLFMFAGVGLYTLAAKAGVGTHAAIGATGGALLLVVVYLFVYLYKTAR